MSPIPTPPRRARTKPWVHTGWVTLLTVGLTVGMLTGCGSPPPVQEQSTETLSPASPPPASEATGTGTLVVFANGEDFVRQGFVSKDGWQIDFNHVYVTLVDLTAYQSDPPFDPEGTGPVQAQVKVAFATPKTVDLAASAAEADPILVDTQTNVPAGRYNALSWRLAPSTTGEAAGYSLVLDGTAQKAGRTIPFVLQFEQAIAFSCGDFVGDERKGILSPNGTAHLEATFHFDHLFGDAEAPADDSLNTGALGFDPLAAITQDNRLAANQTRLQQTLTAADYQKLLAILPSLGHTGEGHCRAEV